MYLISFSLMLLSVSKSSLTWRTFSAFHAVLGIPARSSLNSHVPPFHKLTKPHWHFFTWNYIMTVPCTHQNFSVDFCWILLFCFQTYSHSFSERIFSHFLDWHYFTKTDNNRQPLSITLNKYKHCKGTGLGS